MNELATALFAIVGMVVTVVPVILGLALLGTMWSAWWLYPAWGWFLVPLGVPTINFWHFAALLLLVSTVTNHRTIYKETHPVDWPTAVAAFIVPIVTWALLRWMA